MVFLFDLTASQPNSDGDFHGGGKYAKKVFFELIKTNDSRWEKYVIYDSSKPIDDEILNKCNSSEFKLIDIHNQTLLQILKGYHIDRFYTSQPFNLIKYGFFEMLNYKFEFYCTVHGLRTIELPFNKDAYQYYTLKKFKDKALIIAKSLLSGYLVNKELKRYKTLFCKAKIITVSNHTKYSIMSYFANLTEGIKVFYSPDVTEFEDTSSDAERNSFDQKNYFLMVSGNRWIKNNIKAAVALDSLFSERPLLTQQVIITGVTDPSIYLSKLKNKDRFIFYKYVSESFLKELYKNAFAFLYLSLNEGFGYPPLEAMKFAVPVITSPFTSIPEICGESVLYTNPYSINEIKNRVLQLTDPDIYDKLVDSGQRRYLQIKEIQNADLVNMVLYLLA